MVEGQSESQHIQVAFFSNYEDIPGVENSVFDVPIDADWEKLNALVNTVARTSRDDWNDKRYELLIGSTFVHAPLQDFVDEIIIDIPPKPKQSIEATDWISSLQVLEKLFVSTSYNGEVNIWDRKGAPLARIQREATAVKCSCILQKPSKGVADLRLATGGESGTVWIEEFSSAGESAVVAALRGHSRSVEAVSVSADGTRLLSSGFDSSLKVWNLESNDADVFQSTAPSKSKKEKKESFVTKIPMVTLSGHSDAVIGLCWSPSNAARAFSASWDHSILEWDLELAGQVHRVGSSRAFTSLDIHPRSHDIITGSTDSLPRLFDPRSNEGSLVKESFIGHKGWVSCVRWTVKDDFSFFSSSFDSTVKMWDKRSSKTPLFDLAGHEDRVLCCASNQDTILSGGVDAKINVFSF